MQNSDKLPLFPLPDVVVFPGVIFPLFIFEERYKQLIQDLSKLPNHRQMFVIATNKGEKTANFDNSPFHSRGTICKLVDFKENEHGTFNIVVEGILVADLEEVDFRSINTPYRQVYVKIVNENWKGIEVESNITKINIALARFQKKYNIEFQRILSTDLSEITNSISYMIPIMTIDKLKLLEAEPKERVRLLESLLLNPFTYVPYNPKRPDFSN